MNDLKKRIDCVLSKAESELRALLVAAAEKGDYEAIENLRQIAISIRALQGDHTEEELGNPQTHPESHAASKQPKRGRLKRGGGAYPRFESRKDAIIRIGWSKKERREYRQKVSHAVYESVLRGMQAISAGAPPFQTDQIIEAVNNSCNDDVPSYQVYAIIGLLRERGVIEQIGREGYAVPKNVFVKGQALLRDM